MYTLWAKYVLISILLSYPTQTYKGVLKRGKDIWSQILNERDEKGEDLNNTNLDYSLIFVGDKDAGKTTFINRVHERGKLRIREAKR